MKHGEFLGWDHYAKLRAKRLEIATRAGHPEWIQLPRNRRDAAGATPYFTGKACAQGHISPRYSNGTCRACVNRNVA